MAVSTSAALKPTAARSVRAVAASSPTSFTDPLLVRIPSYGNALSEAVAWQPVLPLPAKGDACLALLDDGGVPWVIAWAKSTAMPPIIEATVSALPPTPVDGEVILYQTEAMAAEGVVWQLRYRASSASSHKWEFIGGPPLTSLIESGETTASGLYVDLGTVGPSVTAPLAGEYVVQFGAQARVVAPPCVAIAQLFIGPSETSALVLVGGPTIPRPRSPTPGAALRRRRAKYSS